MPYGTLCECSTSCASWVEIGQEGEQFTLEAETVCRPYLTLHLGVVSEIYYVTLPAHALRTEQDNLNPSVMMDTLLLRPKGFFFHFSPCIAGLFIKCATWHSLRMR
jgi:hypothetical protein